VCPLREPGPFKILLLSVAEIIIKSLNG
jgi:hypothetical protein